MQIGADGSRWVQIAPDETSLIWSYLELQGCADWSYLDLSAVAKREAQRETIGKNILVEIG